MYFMLTRKPITIFKRLRNNQVSKVEKNHRWRSQGILPSDSLSITWNQNMDNEFINDEDLKRKSAAPLIIFIALVIAETAVICVLLASDSRSASYVKDRSFDALLEQNNVSFLDLICGVCLFQTKILLSINLVHCFQVVRFRG